MPTRAGFIIVAFGVAALIAGRVLGVIEFYVLGTMAVGLVLVAWLTVRFRALSLAISRDIEPRRVPANAAAQVDLRIDNRDRRSSPVLRVKDPVSGTRGARLLVAPVEPKAMRSAAYRLPTDRRGIVEVGPLELTVIDPFGLTRAKITAAPKSDLVVHPEVHILRSLPDPDGTDPNTGADRTAPVNVSGDEFHALRHYVMGDDLRRIHWPSSARHDQLLVRQDERPRQGRITVLLDIREPATVDYLDIASSVAASVLATGQKRRERTRLVTTDGFDSGFGTGSVHADAHLRALALVEPGRTGSLLPSIDTAMIDAGRSSLVIVSPGFSESDSAAVRIARQRSGACAVVVVDPSAYDPSAPSATVESTQTHITVTRDRPFPAVWEQARGRRSSRGAMR